MFFSSGKLRTKLLIGDKHSMKIHNIMYQFDLSVNVTLIVYRNALVYSRVPLVHDIVWLVHELIALVWELLQLVHEPYHYFVYQYTGSCKD